jgi:hypothetical protein
MRYATWRVLIVRAARRGGACSPPWLRRSLVFACLPTKIACDGSDRTCGLATDGHVEVDLLGDLLLHGGARGGGASRAVKMDGGLLFCLAVQSAIPSKKRGKTTGRKKENGAWPIPAGSPRYAKVEHFPIDGEGEK